MRVYDAETGDPIPAVRVRITPIPIMRAGYPDPIDITTDFHGVAAFEAWDWPSYIQFEKAEYGLWRGRWTVEKDTFRLQGPLARGEVHGVTTFRQTEADIEIDLGLFSRTDLESRPKNGESEEVRHPSTR
jgi:hypothetical protein